MNYGNSTGKTVLNLFTFLLIFSYTLYIGYCIIGSGYLAKQITEQIDIRNAEIDRKIKCRVTGKGCKK